MSLTERFWESSWVQGGTTQEDILRAVELAEIREDIERMPPIQDRINFGWAEISGWATAENRSWRVLSWRMRRSWFWMRQLVGLDILTRSGSWIILWLWTRPLISSPTAWPSSWADREGCCFESGQDCRRRYPCRLACTEWLLCPFGQ